MNFLTILLFIILLAVILGIWRTWQIQSDPRQKIFLNGIMPNPPLDGFYNGTVSGEKSFLRRFYYSGSSTWLGKKFNLNNATGTNVFNKGLDLKNELYPFVTRQGKGLLDKNTDVLKIDYNIKENPFWLRFILDEIVQVKPDVYPGKMVLRIIPGLPFGILYFELTK